MLQALTCRIVELIFLLRVEQVRRGMRGSGAQICPLQRVETRLRRTSRATATTTTCSSWTRESPPSCSSTGSGRRSFPCSRERAGKNPNRVASALVASLIVRRNAILRDHLLSEYPVLRRLSLRYEAGSKLARLMAAVGTFAKYLQSVLQSFVRKGGGLKREWVAGGGRCVF